MPDCRRIGRNKEAKLNGGAIRTPPSDGSPICAFTRPKDSSIGNLLTQRSEELRIQWLVCFHCKAAPPGEPTHCTETTCRPCFGDKARRERFPVQAANEQGRLDDPQHGANLLQVFGTI